MSQEIDLILEKEKRRRTIRITLIGLLMVLGLIFCTILITITANQTREIYVLEDSLAVKTRKLANLQKDIDNLTQIYNKLIKDIDQLRMSEKFVKEALDSLSKKNYEAAITIYDRALLLDPTNIVAITNKGFAQLVSGNEKGALRTLLMALQIDSNYAWTHYHLALAYFSSSNSQMGLVEMKKAIYLDPKFRLQFKRDYLFKDIIKKSEVAILLE